jgi:hypothetical protein
VPLQNLTLITSHKHQIFTATVPFSPHGFGHIRTDCYILALSRNWDSLTLPSWRPCGWPHHLDELACRNHCSGICTSLVLVLMCKPKEDWYHFVSVKCFWRYSLSGDR